MITSWKTFVTRLIKALHKKCNGVIHQNVKKIDDVYVDQLKAWFAMPMLYFLNSFIEIQ